MQRHGLPTVPILSVKPGMGRRGYSMNAIMEALGTVALVGVFVLLERFIKQAQAEDRSCAGENGGGFW